MKIIDRDKSSYLKGLLILAKLDNVLSESEERIIKDIASRLGFSTDFYEYTLKNLLANEYLTEEPVQFSDKRVAISFIVDGIRLAKSDSHPDEREISWLLDTLNKNKLNIEWFNKILEDDKYKPMHSPSNEFAIYTII